jgi:DNA-nicking Smr family endonuclease
MNKYLSDPSEVIDLHGYTTEEAGQVLDELVKEGGHKHVRIITGRGNHSPNGPVIRTFVTQYLSMRSISYNRSKLADGGEGAIEVFL